MRILRCFCFACVLALCGCVNVEKAKVPDSWPALRAATQLKEFEGSYVRMATDSTRRHTKEEPFGDLAFFLLGRREADAEVIRLAVDHKTLTVLHVSGDSVESQSIRCSIKDGVLRIRSSLGAGAHPLGGGVGIYNLALYQTTSGDLVGRLSGSATGLWLWCIPTVGFGQDWVLWKREPNQTGCSEPRDSAAGAIRTLVTRGR